MLTLANRYDVQARLGQGGMGVVYRAHDRALDEAVAIKVLRPEVAHSIELAERFRAEIRLARKVGHRNICRIYEYGEDAGTRYIAMELVDGVDLKAVLRERPVSWQEALEIAHEGLTRVDQNAAAARPIGR